MRRAQADAQAVVGREPGCGETGVLESLRGTVPRQQRAAPEIGQARIEKGDAAQEVSCPARITVVEAQRLAHTWPEEGGHHQVFCRVAQLNLGPQLVHLEAPQQVGAALSLAVQPKQGVAVLTAWPFDQEKLVEELALGGQKGAPQGTVG
jgi:hypothetical protein